jgi:DNA-nicking Smr family endonuclease
MSDKDDIYKVELHDELDLHSFHPKDAKALLLDFIESACEKGLPRIRIVHGKGRSVLKRIVIAELERNVHISRFHDEGGNWGATIAYLRVGDSR